MEDVLYYWTGFSLVWLALSSLLFIVVRWVFIKTMNKLGGIFSSMWHFIEFIFYRKYFKEWVKDKERHPKISAKKYDPIIYTPPFRVGRRLGRVVLDSKGLKVVHFESEEQAEKYCDYLNK